MEDPAGTKRLIRLDTLLAPQYMILTIFCAFIYLLTGGIMCMTALWQESWWALHRWHQHRHNHDGRGDLWDVACTLFNICFWPLVWIGVGIYTICDRRPAGYHQQMEVEEWYHGGDGKGSGEFEAGRRGSGMSIVLDRRRLRRQRSREEEEKKEQQQQQASSPSMGPKQLLGRWRVVSPHAIIASITRVEGRVWRPWSHRSEPEYELQELGLLALPDPDVFVIGDE